MESYPCCELTYKEVHKAATHQYDLVEIFREIVQNKKDEDYRGDELEQDTGAGDHLTHDEPCWKGEKIIDKHTNQFTLYMMNPAVKTQRECDKIKKYYKSG